MKQYIVDAFAEELFTGNPAAVVFCNAMPSEKMMQNIAIENNYSETAFVVKTGQGKYDLKWFTPDGEIEQGYNESKTNIKAGRNNKGSYCG